MTEKEFSQFGDVQCRIMSREYDTGDSVVGNLISGLEALPGYVSTGDKVTLQLECGLYVWAIENFSEYLLSKPESVRKMHLLVKSSDTHMRCPVCSGDYSRPN